MAVSREQLKKIQEESQTLYDWLTVKQFCDQIYGPDKVKKVEIESYGEYDDEGGTDYRIEAFRAMDEKEETLSYDFSLPFWQIEEFKYCSFQKKEHGEEKKEEDQDSAFQALKEYYPWRNEKAPWVLWEQLPCDKYMLSFNLTERPKTEHLQL